MKGTAFTKSSRTPWRSTCSYAWSRASVSTWAAVDRASEQCHAPSQRSKVIGSNRWPGTRWSRLRVGLAPSCWAPTTVRAVCRAAASPVHCCVVFMCKCMKVHVYRTPKIVMQVLNRSEAKSTRIHVYTCTVCSFE